jgi:thiamine phosphate synthase YjbQ (UPF0047 family)
MLRRFAVWSCLVLRQHLQRLSLRTRGEGFTNITAALNGEIAASGLRQGLATLVCLHTSCLQLVCSA